MSRAISEATLIEFAKSVELSGSRVLEGLHRSERSSSGIEFQDLAHYSDGEDARNIDWKRYAASDRYLVRKFKQDEKTGWCILIDSSESMNYGSKRQWAERWAGVFLLARVWGDKAQLVTHEGLSFEDQMKALVEHRAGARLVDATEREADSQSHLVILSDFFEEEAPLQKVLKHWGPEFRHLHLVQILSPEESNFTFSGVIEFQDLESTSRLTLDSKAVKARYESELAALQNSLKDSVKNLGIFKVSVSEGAILERQIIEFFEEIEF